MGDITQIIMGQSPDSINYTNNSDDTILIQGNADLNNGIVVPRIWSSQITKKSYPNDIIFTVRAPVGEIARNPYFATIGRGVASFKGNDFLYQSLIQKKENNYWNNISAGSTFDSINSEQLKNVIIDLPKNDAEQDIIGGFFNNLDNLITLHQRKQNNKVKVKIKNCKKKIKLDKNVWEQRKLEEISNRFDNLRIPVSASEREKGIIPYYGANGIQDYVNGFTHNGDYVLIAEDGANDLKNYPVKYVNGLFWANNHVHVIQGKRNVCDNKYLKYCFSKANIEALLVGGGRAKLNANVMMKIELKSPQLNEQIKIGELFTNLDNLITLHQRKCGIFFYSWEQRKLGDECFELIAGGDIDKTRSVNNGKYPIYANALTNDGIVGYYNDSYRVKSPAVTITGRGEIGYAMARNTDFTPVVRLISLRSKHNNYFLANAINLLNVVSESTGVPQLTIPQVEKFDIYFPKNINEEIKLGRLFNEIDNLITLHQHKEIKRRKDKNEYLRW